MKIKKMTATFGRLEGAVLELTGGLNVLQAPNEGGKSTWCAFLRAMFYGIPTRERDTKTTLAEKNRYQPWSGSPMAGEVALTWGGREVILRRFAKGAAPFGGFEGVYADTGEPVPGLTGENCGEVLLGVGREVYQRSAFVAQAGVPIDGNPELERRIAALVSSGEEDVSYSQTEKTLRTWLNRRRHNKTGHIPRLEGEQSALSAQLAQARQTAHRGAEAQERATALEGQRALLETEAEHQRARQDWAIGEQYRQALGELERAQGELAALEGEAGDLPGKEALRKAQGELAYYHALTANLKEAKAQLDPARQGVDEAQAKAADDPLFPGMTPEEARTRAAEDAQQVRALEAGRERIQRVTAILNLLAGVCFVAAGIFSRGNYLYFAAAACFVVAGVGTFLAARRAGENRLAKRAELLARYGATYPDDILICANTYAEKWVVVEEARRKAEAVEGAIRDLARQQGELWTGLLSFTHPFAPTVTDLFGVSAALSRALGMEERLSTARVKAEGAQRLAASLPRPRGEYSTPPPVTQRTAVQTAAALAAVSGELAQLQRELAHARGEGTVQGDPAELEHRLEEVEGDLERRRGEYRALEVALEGLAEANGALQARFSPALNRRAGELFAALTGGRYEGITLTREFEAAAREAGGVLPRRAISLSQGTVDQLYLAVRLAVCELALPGEESVPLVLDDALANFDDGRMTLALDCLGTLAQERQILLFTCHGRERAHLGR